MKQAPQSAVSTTEKKKIHTWAAWVLLAACLTMTALGALYVKHDVERLAKKEFNFGCNEIRDKISDRLHSHARILRGGAAFFEGSDEITRSEWKKFIETQDIENNVPGIPGIGYAAIIRPSKLARHEQEIRNEGFPLYAVSPTGTRTIYTSVIYMEPFKGDNLRTFGYDMFSDSVRRKAMELSRDQDVATLSGKVTLVQDADKHDEPGTLMYVPVYDKLPHHATVEKRRAGIRGWVFCPYRMNDLMKGLLDRWESNESNRIRVEIFDDSTATPGARLFDSREHRPSAATPIFTTRTAINFNGHSWYVRFTQDNTMSASIDYSKMWFVVVGGTAVSILLFTIFLTLINTNVSVQKKAESLTKDLRESENFLDTIIRENPFSIWVSDEHGTLISVNKACTTMLGLPKGDLIGKYNIFNDNLVNDQDLIPLVKKVYERGETVHFHISYNTSRVHNFPGGKTEDFIFDVTIFPIIDASGAVTNAVIQYRDVTEFKNSEQILRDVQRRESIGVLSSGIAHDFNNLLGAMMGNVSIAQTRLPAGHPASANLEKALKAMERAAHLTGQMLAYAGKGKTQDCAIDVAAMIQEHITLFEVSVAKNVKLEMQLPTSPVYVKGDPAQFEQIVMNLITNGSEALEEKHGVVAIAVTAVSLSEADLLPFTALTGSPLKAGDYAMIKVSDNGIGMTAEMQKKIFDPFFTTKFLGRGLGLSAVLGIIRSHEGGIAIESAVGVGTTFRVILPAQDAPRFPLRAPLPKQVRKVPAHATILVIDDDADIAAAAGEMLSSAQYTALLELNPLLGIQTYERLRSEVGLVLLDLTMPEMTGKEAADALRAIDPNVKIIISSGYSEDEGMKRMGGAKISGFIQKPYDMQSLLEIVRKVLAS